MRKLVDSGVYQIRNILNGNLYVGSSRNIDQRWIIHRLDLQKNKHHSRYLQRAWNKYGEKFFVFEVLELCPKEQLLLVEQDFLDDLRPAYNINKIAGSRFGIKFSKESKMKISLALTGIKRSDETKAKISVSKKGTVAWNKGKTMSKESRHKISLARKGKPWTDARRKALESRNLIKEGN